jgi:hypothetical protein
MGFFYHVYTHDIEGSMGIALRSCVQSTGIQGTMDDKLFAILVVTSFMQVSGVLMLPEFFGPTYNLLLLPKRMLFDNLITTRKTSDSTSSGPSSKVVEKFKEVDNNTSDDGDETPETTGKQKKKRQKKKKKKTA